MSSQRNGISSNRQPPGPKRSASVGLRWLKRVTGLVWGAVLLFLVLVALYVALGRQWVHLADHYRTTVAQALSERLGQPVTIDRISGAWRGLDPILSFHGVEVHDKDDPQKVVASLSLARARLDSLSSLLRQRLVFSQLYARGARITVVQNQNGRIGLQGIRFPAASAPESGGSAVDVRATLERWVNRLGRVLSDPAIRISDIRLALNMADRPEQAFQIPLLELAYHGGNFSAGGRLMDTTSNHELASFALHGEHFFRGQFTGKLYLNLTSPRLLDPFLERYQWRDLSVLGASIDAQAWLNFKDGFIKHAAASVRMPYLQLAARNQTVPPIEKLKVLLDWTRPGPGHWQLAVKQLSWSGFGQPVGPVNALISRDSSGWKVAVDSLGAGPWGQLVEGLQVLPGKFTRALANYDPQGRIGPIAARIPADDPTHWQLQAQVENGSARAWNGSPGVSNLAGYFSLNAKGGRLVTNSPNLTLGFPELFAGNWTFASFSGAVDWRMQNGSAQVWSDGLEGIFGTGAQSGVTSINGTFKLGLSPDHKDSLALKIGLRNGDASLLPELVPKKIVDPELYHWLTTAISRADIASGEFEGHGEVGRGAPKGSFSTSMRYHFGDATVRYSPDWPRVEGAGGVVEVQNDRAHIRIDEGRTGGLTLEPGTVDVTPENGHTRIDVSAAARIPPAAIQTWFAQTPLKAYGGDWLGQLAIDGKYHLGLNLGLHLGTGKPADIQLKLKVDDGSLAYAPADLQWQKISGEVTYDSAKGFASQGLTARFLDQPVRLALKQSGADGPVRIVQQGSVKLAALQKELGNVAVPGIKGRTSYTATLQLQGESGPSITIAAPLKGVSSDWPAPLGKKADTEAPLNLRLQWPGKDELLVQGNIPGRLAGIGRWSGSRFEKGALGLGEKQVALPEAQGVSIEGHLARLDVAQWQQMLKSLDQSSAGQSDSPGAAVGGVGSLLQRVSLKTGELLVGGQRYPQAGLVMTPDKDGWTIQVKSPALAGTIRVPTASDQPIRAQLSKASLSTKSAPDLNTVKSGGSVGSPGHWPALDATIGDLAVNGRQYGHWKFSVKPSDDGVRISNIEGSTGSLTLKGNLDWQFERGHSDQTRFNGSLSGGDLRDLSHWLGQKVPLRNKQTNVEFDLHWRGTPEQFSLPVLDGDMKFLLKDGAILQSSDAAQIFRIFGILNTDTIWRRLKLDFSDLYKAGITFDAMSGKALFQHGRLVLDPDMQIVGPSTAFRMSGSTDLVDESLDMRLVVILPLTQNLPLAAVLLGASPPIGGALFVLDKLLGEPLSKLTSATYNISGTWSKPDVKLRNVFDTGADLRKHLSQPPESKH